MDNYEFDVRKHRERIHALLKGLNDQSGTNGIELFRLVRMVANQYEQAASERLRSAELSAPRFALLMRLMAEEEFGPAHEGASPTHLSRCQNVSKNTISALLRGLEDQGLIQRALDPDDRRGARIRISPAGRALVQTTAPGHLAYLNELISDLSVDEQSELTTLLHKLHTTLLRRGLAPRVPEIDEDVAI